MTNTIDRNIVIARNGKAHTQRIVIRHGRFQRYFTKEMKQSAFAGFVVFWSIFWLGALVGVLYL